MTSERPNFSDYHLKAEKDVKSEIRNGRDNYEYSGRVELPAVAENMAYAAKPLIDDVIDKMKTGEPNSLATLSRDGVKLGLSDAPRVDGVSYQDLKDRIQSAHRAASDVEVAAVDRLVEASRLRREADRLEEEVKSGQ